MAKISKERTDLNTSSKKYRSFTGIWTVLCPKEKPGVRPAPGKPSSSCGWGWWRKKANILGRKIVELEVESRGLKAELDDLRGRRLQRLGQPPDEGRPIHHEFRQHLHGGGRAGLPQDVADLEEQNKHHSRLSSTNTSQGPRGARHHGSAKTEALQEAEERRTTDQLELSSRSCSCSTGSRARRHLRAEPSLAPGHPRQPA